MTDMPERIWAEWGGEITSRVVWGYWRDDRSKVDTTEYIRRDKAIPLDELRERIEDKYKAVPECWTHDCIAGAAWEMACMELLEELCPDRSAIGSHGDKEEEG